MKTETATVTAEDMRLAGEIVSFRSVASNPHVIAQQIAHLLAQSRAAERAKIEELVKEAQRTDEIMLHNSKGYAELVELLAAEREASRVRVEALEGTLTAIRDNLVREHDDVWQQIYGLKEIVSAALNPRAACPLPSHEGDAGKE